METFTAQATYRVRMDWGLAGAERLAAAAPDGCLVVVDVLSFTTAVSVAVEHGTAVYPYRWRDDSATTYAAERDAALAAPRREGTEDAPWTLSPAGLRAAPPVARLVLPSPNGSAIAAAAPDSMPVLAGTPRNAAATAGWLRRNGYALTPDRPVLAIAAGERWPDGGLRPALEDHLGAGAVISALVDDGVAGLSPEAAAAAALFDGTPNLRTALRACASGVELSSKGFAADVELAADLNQAPVAAVRRGEAFQPAGGDPPAA